MDAGGVARAHERDERLDAPSERVEVLDAEAIAPEKCPARGDLANVVQVVRVADVRDDDARQVDAFLRERLEGEQAAPGFGVRVHHYRRPGLEARGRDGGENRGHVPDEA